MGTQRQQTLTEKSLTIRPLILKPKKGEKQLIPVLALVGQTKEKDKHGFFGSILLGGGVAVGKPSELEVTDDIKKISTLYERSDNQKRAIPLILGGLGYGFASTGTRI